MGMASHALVADRLFECSSRSACARECGAAKSPAVFAYGCVPTWASASATGWTRVRSRWKGCSDDEVATLLKFMVVLYRRPDLPPEQF